jgi:hypothetical protein
VSSACASGQQHGAAHARVRAGHDCAGPSSKGEADESEAIWIASVLGLEEIEAAAQIDHGLPKHRRQPFRILDELI